MALSLFFLASLALTCLPLSWSYRDGARSESCYNMAVMHTNFLGQVVSPMSCDRPMRPCPYQLRMMGRVVGENNLTVEEENSTTYQCGEVYKLQLASTSGTFEGFMVEARENTPSFEEGSTIWGTWVTDPNNRYHAVECNRSNSSSEGPFEVSHYENADPNAATQNSPDDLTSLDLYWRAPPPPNTTDEYKQLPEYIKFWFVTVQQRLTYIYSVDGPIRERNCSNPPPPPSPSPSLSPSSSPSPSPPSSISPSPSGTTQATTESPPLLSREAFIGLIAGASGGGLLLLALVVISIIVCVYVCVKRSKAKEAEEELPVIFSSSNNKIVI